MLVGSFRAFDSCLAFVSLMIREDAAGNVIMRDKVSQGMNFNFPVNPGPSPAVRWMAGGFNSQRYFFGIGPVRTQASCSTILGTMHREGVGFAYLGIGKIITQAVVPSSLSCTSL